MCPAIPHPARRLHFYAVLLDHYFSTVFAMADRDNRRIREGDDWKGRPPPLHPDHKSDSRRHNEDYAGDSEDVRDRQLDSNVSENRKKRSRNEQLEAERAARMARLRAENDDEEMKLSNIENQRIDDNENSKAKLRPKESIIEFDQDELDGLDESEQMQMLLGFTGSFGSTKGQKVDDNHNSSARGAAAKNKARKYRQYMNRKNGFNRPLDKMD